MGISTPYASTISGRKRRRTGDASIESPTEALHDGSAYDSSTTEALYKSFVQSFV